MDKYKGNYSDIWNRDFFKVQVAEQNAIALHHRYLTSPDREFRDFQRKERAHIREAKKKFKQMCQTNTLHEYDPELFQ